MTTRRAAAGILGVALVALAGPAKAADEEKAVLAAQDRRIAATVAVDVAALEGMTTDDMTYTHSSAVVETRGEFLEALKTARYRYKSVTFDERRVRLHGAAGIVSGTCRALVVSGGRDIDVRLRFTELFVREGGAWKMVLWHSTRVPEPTQ